MRDTLERALVAAFADHGPACRAVRPPEPLGKGRTQVCPCAATRRWPATTTPTPAGSPAPVGAAHDLPSITPAEVLATGPDPS
ncbi:MULTISPECIES: hypothetical protein [Protofrankia]|uniref:Uncharacterized protein n=1 Tax=Protofrankia coriariae TaxID=1562887 RepID=A0ABR5F1L9_9ACTN|nr:MULTISPECIES: hypothetical protein [Protofrankia]KLL10613.1 hypothetical protein FrCorBMG51_16505 [Protofrankia coriariae]ONH35127.1 hypothetical protein BL254_13140 [Protofrankia sp. BMG5.30]